MYLSYNAKSKAEIKRALDDGMHITAFQPGPFGGNPPKDGVVAFEGPHYPKPHRYYGKAYLKDGKVIKVV